MIFKTHLFNYINEQKQLFYLSISLIKIYLIYKKKKFIKFLNEKLLNYLIISNNTIIKYKKI